MLAGAGPDTREDGDILAGTGRILSCRFSSDSGQIKVLLGFLIWIKQGKGCFQHNNKNISAYLPNIVYILSLSKKISR